ncbi:uncharacterized protein [Triticum aestivum]|uniref:uncharacterized protein isoform X2 n=1 Tax=Triticum aestivum TaxID=4565 RepID=UPI001D03526C|nr:uncharacterized protein LOC123040432 isoform X2 [Triticum aestivum]
MLRRSAWMTLIHMVNEGHCLWRPLGSSTGETETSSWVYSMPPGAKRIKPSGFLMLNHLTPLGYPEPPPLMLELDGQLLHKFEEDFGYLYTLSGHSYSRDSCCVGMNPWARLDTKTITTISRRVVSLSSYKGSIRFFSCTGLLIKCPASTDAGSHRRTVILTSASLVRTCDEPDTTDKNLRIEVFLPPKQHAIGTLESYDSHHNIAIVSFKGLRAIRPEDIFDHKEMLPLHVVPIGREPEEGLLCASTGKLFDKPITELPCKHLELSTCIIKKAGIGGPLVNFDDGSFIGMNFYDGKTKGTPFLPRSKILEVLSGLELMSGRGVQKGGDHPVAILDSRAETNTTKRWPVPQAYWHNELLKTDWDGDGFAWMRKFTDVNTGR